MRCATRSRMVGPCAARAASYYHREPLKQFFATLCMHASARTPGSLRRPLRPRTTATAMGETRNQSSARSHPIPHYPLERVLCSSGPLGIRRSPIPRKLSKGFFVLLHSKAVRKTIECTHGRRRPPHTATWAFECRAPRLAQGLAVGAQSFDVSRYCNNRWCEHSNSSHQDPSQPACHTPNSSLCS